MAAIGALLAGFLAGTIGQHPTLIGAITLFAAAALVVALSPLRDAPKLID
jgi:MFS family permease